MAWARGGAGRLGWAEAAGCFSEDDVFAMEFLRSRHGDPDAAMPASSVVVTRCGRQRQSGKLCGLRRCARGRGHFAAAFFFLNEDGGLTAPAAIAERDPRAVFASLIQASRPAVSASCA